MASIPKKALVDAQTEERVRIDRYNQVLLTSSSILSGFAMTGLFGLPELRRDGLASLAMAMGLEPFPMAFTAVFYSTLLATVCFLGVLVAIVSGRLQGKTPRLRTLRSSFRISVLIFGLGLSALFCATITVGVPTLVGFIVGVSAGAGLAMGLFFRALARQ